MRYNDGRGMARKNFMYQDRIVIDPTIMVGKPVVKGTRVTVELVLAKLAHNPDLNALFSDYPRLSIDDIKACLEYAKTLVEKEKVARPASPTVTVVSE